MAGTSGNSVYKSPMKVISAKDGHVYYLINAQGVEGWKKVQRVNYYSSLFQFSLEERAENPMFFVEQAGVNPGGDNYGDPRIKSGWGLYLWVKEDQKYYLISKEDSTDYVRPEDLEAYLKKQVFIDFKNEYTTTINQILEVNNLQQIDIDMLKARISTYGDSLHAHANKETLDLLTSSDGNLFFDGKYVGGNSYVYDVRADDDLHRIYWKNPADPNDVDVCCNTAKEIAEKFCACPLARPGLTLIIVESDDTLSIFRLAINSRTSEMIDKVVITEYAGGKVFEQSNAYYMKFDGSPATPLTKQAMVDQGYIKDIVTYWYRKYSLASAGTPIPIGWSVPEDGLWLRNSADSYTKLSTLTEMSKAGVIEASPDPSITTPIWTDLGATNLYERVANDPVTYVKPTLGKSTTEEIELFGSSFPAGQAIYIGVIMQVRKDTFTFKAIPDQVVTMNTRGITTRLDVLPDPYERYSNLGLFIPNFSNEYGHYAHHVYQCKFVEKQMEFLGTTTANVLEPGWTYLRGKNETWTGKETFEAFYHKHHYVRTNHRTDWPKDFTVFSYSIPGGTTYDAVLIDNKSIDWVVENAANASGNVVYYFTPYQSYMGAVDLYRLRDEYVWEDVTAAGLSDLVPYGAECIVSFLEDYSLWKRARFSWEDPPEESFDGRRLHYWGKTVLVRKNGSAPEHVGDGEVVRVSTVRDEFKNKLCNVDVTPYDNEQWYYRLFSFDTNGALYKPGTAITPEYLKWSTILTLIRDGSADIIFSVGDKIVLPPHSTYGEIECVITDMRMDPTSHGSSYIEVVPTKSICAKIMDAVEYTYFTVAPGTKAQSGVKYFTKGTKSSHYRTWIHFTEVGFTIGTTLPVGVYQRVPATETPPTGRSDYVYGKPNGSTEFGWTDLFKWLNGEDENWFEDTASTCAGDVDYKDEMGFLGGFEDTSMFKVLDEFDNKVTLPSDEYISKIVDRCIDKAKLPTYWWTQSVAVTDESFKCGKGGTAYVGRSCAGVSEMSKVVVPGVLPLMRIG